MITYVLDSSAALRYFDDGAGADRVEEVLNACASRRANLTISALQWGEIAGKLRKRFGESDEMRLLGSLLPSEATIISASADRAVHAAALIADPTQLPQDHQAQIPTQGLARTVADYIAGMTDSYIVQLWQRCGGR